MLAGAFLRIRAGPGGVTAAAGSGPVHHARFGLVEAPAFGLFTAVMVAAEGGKAAFAGPAALVKWGGVVKVAADGGPPAAGGRTGGRARIHQMLQMPTRPVTRLLVAGGAGAPGQRVDGQRQASGR